MNKIKAIAFGAIIFALLACEQPFKAGLGPVVDIRPPTVTLDSPGAGGYIWGTEMQFHGTAEDDYILSKVEFKVTNRPTDKNGNPFEYFEYTSVQLDKHGQNHGTWSLKLDTTVLPEGDLKIRLKVTDSVGKWTETDEIVFQVKNERPKISVSAPYIAESNGDTKRKFDDIGNVGGDHLNYYADRDTPPNDSQDVTPKNPNVLPDPLSFPRSVAEGGFLTGSISDDQGIYVGQANAVTGRFPPQYRYWRVVDIGANNTDTFQVGVLPSESQLPWKAFTPDELFPLVGVGNYQFALELPKDPRNFYGFEIRAQSIDETGSPFRYPRGYYTDGDTFENLNGTNEENWRKIENRYVLVYIADQQMPPQVEFYALEDILGVKESTSAYHDLVVGEKHPYVDGLTVNKNGPFTLRVKAWHPEGILSAEVYWEDEISGDRGRFIWDLANEIPPGSGSYWVPGNTVGAGEYYSLWGYRDQLSPDSTRNFIFTYKDDGNDRIPAGNAYQSQVRGRSKIQKYKATGPEADRAWQNKHSSLVPWSYEGSFNTDMWEEWDKLEEGVYKIEVFAISRTGEKSTRSPSRTVRMDKTEPTLELLGIDGAYGPADGIFLPDDGIADSTAYVVNGVIRPRLLLNDSRLVDSGLRTGTVDYFKPGGGVAVKEQFFVVVDKDDDTQMDRLRADKNWWPTLPSSDAEVLTITPDTGANITVRKHGRIEATNNFLLKTSAIYNPAEVTDILIDGDYWLYVFARDNAFNVASNGYKLVVRKDSDIPRFDFTDFPITNLVTIPGYPDDLDRSGHGFFLPGASATDARNLLGVNQNIRVRITDDDSLDLGTDSVSVDSKVQVSFYNTKQVFSNDEEENGDVTVRTTMPLPQTLIKKAFGVQSTERRPVKDRTGTITQEDLHKLINSSATGKLPDGIYKLGMAIEDHQDSKLTMTLGLFDAATAKESTYFWFAVDNTPPAFVGDIYPPKGSATLSSLNTDGVSGTVSDANGPITVDYNLTGTGGLNINGRAITDATGPNTSLLDQGIWQIGFNIKLGLPNTDGTYTLRLTARDRFGKETIETLQYTIDQAPPEVTINRDYIPTVDRSGFFVDGKTLAEQTLLINNGLGNISKANLANLANGVVRFTLRATDNSGVEELRWWLLTAPPANWDSVPTAAEGRSGRTTDPSAFNAATFRVDTNGLSGVYHLYARARDIAGNTSEIVNLQTIYIDQESDKPFFADNIKPVSTDTIGKNRAVVTGTIYEDDGFQNDQGNGLRAGSIRVWATGTPSGTSAQQLENPTTYGYAGPVTVTLTNQNSLNNGKNISLNIDLAALFPAQFVLDGDKYYIIEATDSAYAKYLVNGNPAPATTQVSRRMGYSFKYDTKPPVIKISFPGENQSFAGEDDGSFKLVGFIQDVNLDQRNEDGTDYYYFTYRLNDDITPRFYTFTDTSEFTVKKFTALDLDPEDPTIILDETRVSFTIEEPENVAKLLYTDNNKFYQGWNTLRLTALDKSGQEGNFQVKFFIDDDGPNIILDEREIILEDLDKDFEWFKSPPDLTWYQNRRNKLLDQEIPVIQRESGAFYLTGSFVDDASDVDGAFTYRFDGDTGDRSGTAFSVNGKTARWRVDLQTLSDGLHHIKITAKDSVNNKSQIKTKISKDGAGNFIEGSFAFRINSGQPTVAFNDIEMAKVGNVIGNKANQSLDEKIFTVTGSATSPNLENVNLIIRHTALVKDASYTPFSVNLVPARGKTTTSPFIGDITNDWNFTGTSPITEKLEWTLAVTRDNLNVAGNDTSLKEGTYEVAIASIDMYGEESEEKIWTFTVDKTSPVFTFSRLIKGKDINEQANDSVSPYDLTLRSLSDKTIMVANPAVSGRIQDTLSKLTAVQRQIRKWNYGTAKWEYYNFAGSWIATEDSTNTVYWNDVTTGIGTQDCTVDWNLKGTPGLENLGDGFYSIRLRAKDSSIIVGGNTSWNIGSNGNYDESDYLYFFYAFNAPEIAHVDPAINTYSSLKSPHNVSLGVTIKDANRFLTLKVNVTPVNVTATAINQEIEAKVGSNWISADTWNPIVPITFTPRTPSDSTSGYPEGNYRISFEITDVAGRYVSINRVIYLDNNPPKGTIDEPRFVGEIYQYNADGTTQIQPPKVLFKYPSEVQIGGETLTINGTAEDVSGIKELWFHLGYGDITNPTGFPEPEDAERWFGTGATPPLNSAWFKYVLPDSAISPPPEIPNPYPPLWGFEPITDAFLSKWSLTMTNEAIEAYANEIIIRGVTYNRAGGRWMVRPIDETNIPQNYKRGGGLYSLPLYVRVVDNAGNVSYTQRDIWIYPDGDIPSTTIINPAAVSTPYDSARGGQVRIEGVASDNISVRRVIYRVKADDEYRDSNIMNDPGDSKIIKTPIGTTPISATTPEYPGMNTTYRDYFNEDLAGNGWYVASLETQDYGQSVPWNFTLNANGEFASVIENYGFDSREGFVGRPSTTPGYTKNMVRLYIEIYVFDAEAQVINNPVYHLISKHNGTKDIPKPFVRVFYLKNSSPKISNPQLSVKTATGSISASPSFGGYDLSVDRVRRGQFAIRASLSGSGNPIEQVSVRLPLERTGTGWTTIHGAGAVPRPDGLSLTLNNSGTPTNPILNENGTITWLFDSLTATSGYKQVRRLDSGASEWASDGGRYTIDVRIRDNSSGEDIYTFEVNIDNFAPLADTSVAKSTPGKVAGSNVAFQGRVFDYYDYRVTPQPPYGGIQQVTAWFTKGTNYVNMANGTNSALTPATRSSRSALNGRTATIAYETDDSTVNRITRGDAGSPLTVNYPLPGSETVEGISYEKSTDYVKIITERTAGPLENKITWQETTNRDVYWSFITDTTKLPDGRITLHYLVEDSSGNVSYFTQNTVVMNKYPEITDLVLYTDNTGEGAVFTTHEGNQAYSEYPVNKGAYNGGTYLNSGFISKNRVIGFGVKTLKGAGTDASNDPLHYRVQYVERILIPLSNANLRKMAGGDGGNGYINLYTINTPNALAGPVWNDLGVIGTPAQGSNFVFQASLAQVGNTIGGGAGMDYSLGSVYGYRQILATPTRNRSSTPYPPDTPTTPNPFNLDVIPDDLNFSGTTFTGITGATGSQPGKIDKDDDTTTAFFVIKVWDTVNDASTNEADMLYDAVVVGMNVYITDNEAPTARLYDLNPYTETAVRGNNIGDWDGTNQSTTRKNAADPTAIGTNILRGGLYNIGTERVPIKSGYIDPRNNTSALHPWLQNSSGDWENTTQAHGYQGGDSYALTVTNPTRDKVSGRIILRGLAYDDQLIDEISITIGSVTTSILKLQYVLPDGTIPTDQTTPAATRTDFAVKKMWRNSTTMEAWAVETLHWETGHTVEWACIWDTETYNTTHSPAQGVTVTVSVTDKNGPNGSGTAVSAPTTVPTTRPTVFHNQTTVDIEPYVYGFERKSIYNNTRSRQGWYSFYQGETGITILGYNLGTTGLTMTVGGVTIATPSYIASTATPPAYSGQRWNFSIPDSAVSGQIAVMAGTRTLYNHNSNHVDKSWNKEYYSLISGSDLWINKPHAHIWRTEQTNASATPYTYFGQASTDDTKGLSRPSMALEYVNDSINNGNDPVSISGRLTGVWASYGNADSYYARNDGKRRMGDTKSEDDIRGFWGATDGGSNDPLPGEPYLANDVSFYNGSTYRGALVATYEADGQPRLYVRDGGNTANTAIAAYNFNTALAMSPADYSVSTQRWQNSRIVRSLNRSHIVSYNSSNKNLRYVNRTLNNAYEGSGNNYVPIVIDGSGANSTGITVSNDAGMYSAIDYDSTGPIVAYYDTQNGTLRIAYASQENPAAGNWTRRYVMASTDPWYSGSGQHVSMKVDKDGGIHLAFYNSKEQTIVYAYASERTTATTYFTTYAVDRGIKGGTWTDISVDDNGNPMIVYGETARMGNYDGARMAYKSSSSTGFAFTDPWEAVTMPSDSKVKNDRLNIEAWPPTNRAEGAVPTRAATWGTWNAAIGYAGEKTDSGINTFRIGYFTYPTYKGY